MGSALIYKKKRKATIIPPIENKVYGVRINSTLANPETSVVYTDDAIGMTPANGNNGNFDYGSWGNIYPFNAVKPCLMKDGEVIAYLDPNDYTKHADTGETVEIGSTSIGDVMIEIPKVYFKLERDGIYRDVKFSKEQIDESYKAYAHMKGDVEKDFVYIGAYFNRVEGVTTRSISNRPVSTSVTLNQIRTYCQNKGEGYEPFGFYQLTLIQVLYTIMFKNLNSQQALGNGATSTSLSSSGTGNKLGLNYGLTSNSVQLVKFLGIEHIYGGGWSWIDGVFVDADFNIHSSSYGFGEGTHDYNIISSTGLSTALNGYMSDMYSTTELGFTPSRSAGTNINYYADSIILAKNTNLLFGGHWTSGTVSGMYAMQYTASGTTSATTRTSRMMYL